MLIDTHCHLNLPPLVENWQQIAELAAEAGVKKIVVPGANLDSSLTAVKLAQANTTNNDIVTAVGIHPEEVKADSSPETLAAAIQKISDLTKSSKVVGIGEIGLDYHYANIETQKFLFQEQLSIAKESNLPVIIHTRQSQAIHDACNLIIHVFGSRQFKGVFHCFTGSKSHYDRIRELGGYIGVGGLITYHHNTSLQKVIKSVPLEKIVLETDAPWLVPAPKTDKYNQPANIPIIALKLTEIQSQPIAKIINTTTQNALELVYG